MGGTTAGQGAGRPVIDTVVGEGSARLRTLRWPVDDPRGCMLVVHGLGEHGGRYGELAGVLTAAGFTVLAYDQRGHGGSEGRRGWVESFETYLQDLDAVLGAVERRFPRRGPPFLLGHSLGGLVVLRWLQTRGRRVPGAVLVAPWLATSPLPWWERWTAALLRRVAPGLAVRHELEPEALTRDPEKQRALDEDRLIHHRVSAGLLAECEEAQNRAGEAGVDSSIPLLFLIPGDDPVVDSRATERYARALGGGASVEVLEGRRHEPLNDLGREEVFDRIVSWLEQP